MSTCVELAGATYPKEYQGRAILPTAGQKLTLPVYVNPVCYRMEYDVCFKIDIKSEKLDTANGYLSFKKECNQDYFYNYGSGSAFAGRFGS